VYKYSNSAHAFTCLANRNMRNFYFRLITCFFPASDVSPASINQYQSLVPHSTHSFLSGPRCAPPKHWQNSGLDGSTVTAVVTLSVIFVTMSNCRTSVRWVEVGGTFFRHSGTRTPIVRVARRRHSNQESPHMDTAGPLLSTWSHPITMLSHWHKLAPFCQRVPNDHPFVTIAPAGPILSA
jgi:hypothetical protein